MPYNNMLMPTGFGHPKAEYDRLLNGVSMWDVGVERQVQLQGPDAAILAQILTPRDLSKCKVGQGKYVAICNHAGTLINDPILLKLAEDKFWLSIADANILFWARAIAAERRLNVEVSEPDVSPLAIQGPQAENVVAKIFGDWIRDLKYFWFKKTSIQNIPVAVARSGYSKQGGFEIYLLDGTKGTELWNIVKEAGQPWGIGPGNPNAVERVESGLLSWGGDTDDTTNPYEVRMGDYIDLDVPDDVVGIKALRNIWKDGPKRHQLGIILEGDKALPVPFKWFEISQNGTRIGDMTNCIWSYRLEKNIGFALVNRSARVGDAVELEREGRKIKGSLQALPFL
jgi:aminomethyltransferase